MSIESGSEIKICPYWRRIFQSGEHVLALCGKESPREPRLPENELFTRLRRCPWYNKGAEEAYEIPIILECHLDQIRNKTGVPLEISGTNCVMGEIGKEGDNCFRRKMGYGGGKVYSAPFVTNLNFEQ